MTQPDHGLRHHQVDDDDLAGMLQTIMHNQQVIYNRLTGLLELTRTGLHASFDTEGKVTQMALDLSTLQTQVDSNGAVDQSAITLIEGIAAQLTAAAGDPAAVQALADALSAQSASLAASVAANTPAAPAV